MNTTPIAAMEKLVSLEILVLGDARVGAFRLKGHGKIKQIIVQYTYELSRNYITPQYSFDKAFRILIERRDKRIQSFLGSLILYTDGSKMDKGIGFGICEMTNRCEISVSLGTTLTVYQVEIYVINLCIRENIEVICKIFNLPN